MTSNNGLPVVAQQCATPDAAYRLLANAGQAIVLIGDGVEVEEGFAEVVELACGEGVEAGGERWCWIVRHSLFLSSFLASGQEETWYDVIILSVR